MSFEYGRPDVLVEPVLASAESCGANRRGATLPNMPVAKPRDLNIWAIVNSRSLIPTFDAGNSAPRMLNAIGIDNRSNSAARDALHTACARRSR
jgi:hypothetical protein